MPPQSAQYVPLTEVFTGTQVRDAERPLVEAGHGPALMQQAASGLAAQVLRSLRQRGRIYGAGVTALVGSGNNGADALYALLRLRRRGVRTRAVLVSERCHEAALTAYREAGGRTLPRVPGRQDVIIDAVLGTGASRRAEPMPIPGLGEALRPDVRHEARGGIRRHEIQRPEIIACDIPSGVSADTGEVLSDYGLTADRTVTFGAVKLGLVVGAGAALSGQIHCVDIGLGPHLPQASARLLETPSAGDRAEPDEAPGTMSGTSSIELRELNGQDHKYARGVLHVVAGSTQYPGAAQLSVAAAVGTGAGMVTVDSEAQVSARVTAVHPEVVALPTDQALRRANAVALGPGLNGDAADEETLESVLAWSQSGGGILVLDASGIGLLRPERLRSGALSPNVVLTPHAGELHRLVSRIDEVHGTRVLREEDGDSPVASARAVAGYLGAVVLLKGAGTVIAEPQGSVIVHRCRAPGLATAGSGDVLTGVIGALAAHDGRVGDMAALGSHIHAAAAHQIDPRGAGAFGAADLVAGIRQYRS